MYITNNPIVSAIAEKSGVDRIFIDMEYIGKNVRQGGMDTVQSHHTINDIGNVRKAITKSELLVRINPIHDKTEDYCSTEEVERFHKAVNGRVKTILLIETPEAVNNIDDILKVTGIDEYHIGINDLSLGYGKKFMFEVVADGTVENLCKMLSKTGKPYGFGGIASLGRGLIPAENVIIEHYRLKSSMAILSRSFCNTEKTRDISEIETVFSEGIREIREFENKVVDGEFSYEENFEFIKRKVKEIVG